MTDSTDHKKGKNKGDFSDDDWQAFLDDIENPQDKDMGEELEPKQEPSSSQTPNEYALEVDLHGLGLEEAKTKVQRAYAYACSQLNSLDTKTQNAKVWMRIITGKGRHSGVGGAVLPAEIYAFVSTEFKKNILNIDPPPTDATLGGLPVKGHFDVVLSVL